MAINQALLPEFDQEMANTRKMLERVPDGKFDWKPHDKSMTQGRLASHVAQLPTWATTTINQDSLDLAPPGGPQFVLHEAANRQEVLAIFDKSVVEARAAIAAAGDQALMQPWSLLKGGHTLMTMPRIAVLRSFVMNHLIHHRAQLGVYLRLQSIPVPGMYGPSADEAPM